MEQAAEQHVRRIMHVPKMWIKIGDNNEVDVESITSNLKFLGEESSPVLTNNYTDGVGTDGSQFNFATFNKSTVNAKFWLRFSDYYDLKLSKHDIYSFFSNKQLMRIRTDANPAKVMFVRARNFEIAPTESRALDASFTIPFDNPSGYLYSLVNSDVLKEYGQEAWQYGQNLPNGKDLQYQFIDQSEFQVYNASDITVDPYFQRHQLKIIIKHSGGGFGITNETTGDAYRFNGSMRSSDTLMIDGINTYLNGKLADNQTNYGYLSLEPGWNDIKITGAVDLDITFSFPFIYLA